MTDRAFDISILTTTQKKSVAVETLSPKYPDLLVYVNQQWPLPPITDDWNPKHVAMEPNTSVCYRIFRGHQEMLQLGNKKYILALEDDAVPGTDWDRKVNCLLYLLEEQFEIIALYSKAQWRVERSFQACGLDFIIPGHHPTLGVAYQNGAVAYLTTRKCAEKIGKLRYTGVPFDLAYCQPADFKFAAVKENCCIFSHSYEFGSHRDGNQRK